MKGQIVMALLIIYPDMELKPYVEVLLNLDPQLDIRIWPQIGNADDIEFAIAWNHPPGEFKKFRNLFI